MGFHACGSVTQSCPTLCNPVDCSLPGSSVHEIIQAGILEWVAFPPPGDLPDLHINQCLLCLLQRQQILYHWAIREAHTHYHHFSSVQRLSPVWLFVTPWIAARQASLSITSSRSPPTPMSIKSMMPSNHLILCRPLLLLPSVFPSIRVFSSESTLHIRWPKYWEFQLQHQSFQWTPRTDLL